MQYILVVVIRAFSMVVQYYADLYNVSYIFATTSSGSMIHWAAVFLSMWICPLMWSIVCVHIHISSARNRRFVIGIFTLFPPSNGLAFHRKLKLLMMKQKGWRRIYNPNKVRMSIGCYMPLMRKLPTEKSAKWTSGITSQPIKKRKKITNIIQSWI